MDKKYFIESGEDAHQIIQLLENKIYEHNSTKIRKDDGSLFARIVRDENNEIIAGIAGWTWANICEITQLWVDENARKNGIGRMLLKAAEAEAKSKECRTILIKSYSFQAPLFYEKHGYKVEHILNDYPAGYSYYTLTKRID
jgi:ribosomal protein S18 acetylase RimI-like enzyme